MPSVVTIAGVALAKPAVEQIVRMHTILHMVIVLPLAEDVSSIQIVQVVKVAMEAHAKMIVVGVEHVLLAQAHHVALLVAQRLVVLLMAHAAILQVVTVIKTLVLVAPVQAMQGPVVQVARALEMVHIMTLTALQYVVRVSVMTRQVA